MHRPFFFFIFFVSDVLVVVGSVQVCPLTSALFKAAKSQSVAGKSKRRASSRKFAAIEDEIDELAPVLKVSKQHAFVGVHKPAI